MKPIPRRSGTVGSRAAFRVGGNSRRGEQFMVGTPREKEKNFQGKSTKYISWGKKGDKGEAREKLND